eukprot:TRINITY_DN10581_c0_g1_i1.p1 TRINITY_DN10581_c0_g1~~TRINITY_DN10581_c0_g1_i1.p1  ORF type:complete len:428 (+),score=86.65 TRINITY_DN10581_c0_g1_i1:70-1284(+)
MAPTEFLAQQHMDKFSQLCSSLPEYRRPKCALLTGSTKKVKAVRQAIQVGEVNVIIGTHALLANKTGFHRLGLAVIDEQHRFGVGQREILSVKGSESLLDSTSNEGSSLAEAGAVYGSEDHARPLTSTHILVMSATPIPRTLALAMHGDSAISQISEIPPGRGTIVTKLFVDAEDTRREAYQLLRDEVKAGGRAFVVFPLVGLSDAYPLMRAAKVEYEELTRKGRPLAGLACGLVHGQMDHEERRATMGRFKSGELQVLVATTVVEVGIDIPEATVMLVEHAERYGMAQLHQLRGRVGRGARSSLCILLASTEHSVGRLKPLVDSQDGFHLAELDLRFRGHGELLGKKQSGHLPDFLLLRYDTDGEIIEMAREAAEDLVTRLDELPKLKRELASRRRFRRRAAL